MTSFTRQFPDHPAPACEPAEAAQIARVPTGIGAVGHAGRPLPGPDVGGAVVPAFGASVNDCRMPGDAGGQAPHWCYGLYRRETAVAHMRCAVERETCPRGRAFIVWRAA
jgi:hypothetical protein